MRLKQGQLFVAEIDTEHPRENCFLSATEGDVIRMTAVTNQAQGIEQLALISRAGWVTSPDDIRARL